MDNCILLKIPSPVSTGMKHKPVVFSCEHEGNWDYKELSSTEICLHNKMRFHPGLVITMLDCCLHRPSQMAFLHLLLPLVFALTG